MFNFAILLFFIIVIFLIILFIVFTIIGVQNYTTANSTIVLSTRTNCDLPLDQLIQINTNSDICCYNNGQLTGAYYVETDDGLAYSVIGTATYYVNVCREYCSFGYTVTDTGTIQCENESSTGPQTTQANTCVAELKPEIDGTACRGSALPIAARNTVFYYANHAAGPTGIAQCLTQGPC